jgi:GTP cyclohydrolase IA
MKHLDEEKALHHYTEFMKALGLDLEDPNTKDTPARVVKKFKEDIFAGLYTDKPGNITTFPNEGYEGLIFQGDIEVHSVCSHHHLPIIGKAYVAYIPEAEGNIIGLSKLNRVVNFFARRPQVQENLTQQVHDYLKEILGDTKGIAVYIRAQHTCVSMRGIKQNSRMSTSTFSGAFLANENKARDEFFEYVKGCGNKI